MAGFGAFLTHVFFSLPQEEEKNLKKIFNTSIIFDFISKAIPIGFYVARARPTVFFHDLK